ncbi:helix-turn-helix transcriptional regulator [Pediococcus parvulus]|uniref:helix-turn-helix transcriptional regulator n=1 Tax=Pediococcus parvulus TaxID=54062 RepID=UPI003D023E4D
MNSNSHFGIRLKKERKRQKMTQQQLAEGICSQSMLSSIENETYIPNVVLFAQLCARLNLSVERMLLNPYPILKQQPDFNDTIIHLCNLHHYDEMQEYLAKNEVITQLVTNSDLQTYYYYLGISTYQSQQDWQAAIQQLTLARTYTSGSSHTALELLIEASLAYIKFFHGSNGDARTTFSNCLTLIQNEKVVLPNDNLNSIYYLYANCLFNNSEFEPDLQVVNQGMTYITAHDSHFMLADLLLLKSAILSQLKQPQAAKDSAKKAQTLSEIFQTELFPLPNVH